MENRLPATAPARVSPPRPHPSPERVAAMRQRSFPAESRDAGAFGDPTGAPADLVFTHGIVLTLVDPVLQAEAAAVRGGRIVAVGNHAWVSRLIGPSTEVVDLAGWTLLPGFVEARTDLCLGVAGVDEALGRTRDWVRAGCTTALDHSVGLGSGPADLDLIRTLADARDCPLRLRAAITPHLYRLNPDLAPGEGDDRLRVDTIDFASLGLVPGSGGTVSVDGRSTPGESAAPGAIGMAPADLTRTDDDELLVLFQAAHAAGWRLSVPAPTGHAVDRVLTLMDKVFSENPRPHRHVLYDVVEASGEQLIRIARLGLAVSQPAGAPSRSTLRAGIAPSLYREHPGTAVAPLSYVAAATAERSRRTGGEQRIPVTEALRMVTLYPARQAELDHEIGTIQVGRRADLVVIDGDPRAMHPSEIAGIAVRAVYRDGRRVKLG
jgi:predicted amidohydrolase YtcJ